MVYSLRAADDDILEVVSDAGAGGADHNQVESLASTMSDMLDNVSFGDDLTLFAIPQTQAPVLHSDNNEQALVI